MTVVYIGVNFGVNSMKGRYKVNLYLGIPVNTDPNGKYVIRRDRNGNYKLNQWRTGKHTKGHFKRIGQVFLTENSLRVAVVAYRPVKFNHRHRYTPLRRFTTAFVNSELIQKVKEKRP